MKSKITYHSLASLFFAFLVSACASDPSMPEGVFNAKAPLVETLLIKAFTDSTAIIEAEVKQANGSPITQCGVEYGIAEDLLDKRVVYEEGEGLYSLTLSNLKGNQTYYVRAYAKNEVGISYGKKLSFTTSDGLWIATKEYVGTPVFPGSAA